jgi:hypothetical protein
LDWVELLRDRYEPVRVDCCLTMSATAMPTSSTTKKTMVPKIQIPVRSVSMECA